MILFSFFLNQFSIFDINYQKNFINKINLDLNCNFLIKNSKKLQSICKCYLLVDCNLNIEYPNIYLNLSQRLSKKEVKVFSIGFRSNLKLFKYLGFSLDILINILEGKHEICRELKTNKNFILIFGKNFFLKNSHFLIFNFIKYNYKKLIDIVYPFNPTLINFFEIFGNINQFSKNYKILYLYNTKNFLTNLSYNKNKLFIIYHGSHKTSDSLKADLILPLNIFYEKKNKFINIFGYFKKSNKIVDYFLYLDDYILINELKLFEYLIPKKKYLKNFFII